MHITEKPYNGLASAKELYANRRQIAEQSSLKEQKIIGYYCCFPPAELITAAGFAPYRITGDIHEPVTSGGVYLDANMCPFVRSSFDLAVKGEYSFLQGIVVPNACRNLRRFHIFWKDHVNPPFVHYLNVPHMAAQSSINFYREEFVDLKKHLEEFAGFEITNEQINEAIKLHNKNRALLRKLNDTRKNDVPLLSGAEMIETLVAGLTIPADQATLLYESIIDEATARKKETKKRPRLLVLGSVVDNPEFYRLVDSCGADIVVDDLCFGTRTYLNDVEVGDDPLQNLSAYYLGKTMCPRTYRSTPDERFGHAKQLAADFNADGVILYSVRFCDTVKLEAPATIDYLEQAGLPVLYIEDDYVMSSPGTLKTKFQAFIEMIE